MTGSDEASTTVQHGDPARAADLDGVPVTRQRARYGCFAAPIAWLARVAGWSWSGEAMVVPMSDDGEEQSASKKPLGTTTPTTVPAGSGPPPTSEYEPSGPDSSFSLGDLLDRETARIDSPNRSKYKAIALAILRARAPIAELITEWKADTLDKADPSATSPDAYAEPIITIAEVLRLLGFGDAARRVYLSSIEAVEQAERSRGVRFHKGALFANVGIVHLELGLHGPGLSFLRCAGEEDTRTYAGVSEPAESYALRSRDGILGQWVRTSVIPCLPHDTVHDVQQGVRPAFANADVEDFVTWCLGFGDLTFCTALLDFEAVRGRTDSYACAERFQVLRTLATCFEVTLKRIGSSHQDPAVVAAFQEPPMLADILCFMHNPPSRRALRRDPTLTPGLQPGIFNNSTLPDTQVLDAIRAGFTLLRGVSDLGTAHGALAGSTLSPDGTADLLGRRFLWAHRVRNLTSHNFSPEDAHLVADYDSCLASLCGAILLAFEWSRASGGIST